MLGMMGDGQLGRMFCQAAQAMGFKVVVIGSEPEGPAAQIAQKFICADYEDEQALQELTESTKFITTEFENIPAQSLKTLSMTSRVAPCAAAVAVVQNRISEKGFVSALDIPVAPYAEIRSEQDIDELEESLFPGILKIATMGYDGKGQETVKSADEAREAFKQFRGVPCVLERMLDLDYEVSVVLGRAADGTVECFPMGVNNHIDGILSSTTVLPDLIAADVQTRAREDAIKIATELNYVGVLCVEFFVLKDGSLIVNEIAPRPHNSGHYTLNACHTSQFEQQVRALAGLPLGGTELLSPVIMLNLLGDCWLRNSEEPVTPEWHKVLALPGVHLHLYGKAEPRIGRKMGHINIVDQDRDRLFATAQKVSDILGLGAELDHHER